MGKIKAITQEFWDRVSFGENRAALLREFAERRIYQERDARSIRHSFQRRRRIDRVGHDSVCFVCGGKAVHTHHIVQIQHGGSNMRRNTVTLCRKCHSDVHPWLLAC